MTETTTEIATGEELAQALAPIIANADAESVRVVLRDRLRRTEPWVARAHHHRKLLGAAVVALGKAGSLEPLLRLLDRGDQEAHRRWQRDNPELHPRLARTADQLRVFLAESGTPAARAALSRALRAAEALGGQEAADHVAAHLAANDEPAAARVIERLVDRFFGQPEADEVRGLRADLDGFLKSVVERGLAQATARAIVRRSVEGTRRLGPIDTQDLHEQLRDLMKRYASDAVATRWAKAVGREDVKGRAVGKEVARLLRAGEAPRALDHLIEDVLAPLDDRFAADPGAQAIERLEECMDELDKAKAIAALVEAAYEADVAFQRANPHVLFVGALSRWKAALDKFGKAAAKERFAAPFAALEARLAPSDDPPNPASPPA